MSLLHKQRDWFRSCVILFCLLIVVFSLITTDPQYCDAENGSDYAQTVVRRYRHSLDIVKKAAMVFEQRRNCCNVILGDTIDGRAKQLGNHKECMTHVKEAIGDNYHYVLGNHEYYNFNRSELMNLMIPESQRQFCTEKKLYYDFSPVPGYRFIVLDGYDYSIIGASSEQLSQTADRLVRDKNSNYRNGSNDWFVDIPVEDYRYVPFNGGISEAQFQWLTESLSTAKSNNELCYIFCHQPVFVKSSKEVNLLWNAEDVLNLIQHPSNCHVIAFFAGHDHDGGYCVDDAGIHHLVPPSPLECEVGEVAFGSIDVYTDHMTLDWNGRLPPRCIGNAGAVDSGSSIELEDTALKKPFSLLSTPCIWPKLLPFRSQSIN